MERFYFITRILVLTASLSGVRAETPRPEVFF